MTPPNVTNLRSSRELAAHSPAELTAAARSGDAHAVGELYRRTIGPARAAARGLCSDADADDAVAEGFSRAVSRLDRLVDPAAVEPWIIRCVSRAAIDLTRQRRRQLATGDLEARIERVSPPAESAAERALAAMEQRALAAVLSQLDPGPQLLLRLRYEAGLSVRHIAAALGRPDGTIRRQCVEARRMAGERFLGRQLRPATGACERAINLLCQAPYRRPSLLAVRRLDDHLRGCPACRDRQVEVAERLTELGLRGMAAPASRTAA